MFLFLIFNIGKQLFFLHNELFNRQHGHPSANGFTIYVYKVLQNIVKILTIYSSTQRENMSAVNQCT